MTLVTACNNKNFYVNNFFCEAQGKGRAKGRLLKVTLRSFIDYRLAIINILSIEITSLLELGFKQ